MIMENIYIVEKIYNEENKKDENAHYRIIMHKYFNNIIDLSEYIQKDINEEHIKYFEDLNKDCDKLKCLLSQGKISLEEYLKISLEEYLKRSGESAWVINHVDNIGMRSRSNGYPFLWERIRFKRPMLENVMVIDYVVHEIPYGGH